MRCSINRSITNTIIVCMNIGPLHGRLVYALSPISTVNEIVVSGMFHHTLLQPLLNQLPDNEYLVYPDYSPAYTTHYHHLAQ